jgi:hypothetical protein
VIDDRNQIDLKATDALRQKIRTEAKPETRLMVIALGEGSYRYQLACAGRNWGELPDGWRFGDVAAVGVDRHDNLYVFARGITP